MAKKERSNLSKGTLMAIAVVLLWFAGVCYFFAFLAGKTAALTSGRGSDGAPSGPRDMSGVVARVATNLQAMESSGGPAGSTGTVTTGTEQQA